MLIPGDHDPKVRARESYPDNQLGIGSSGGMLPVYGMEAATNLNRNSERHHKASTHHNFS